MPHQNLPREIEVYEIGTRRLYVKTGARNFALSEDDLTPEELLGIARDIAARQGKPLEIEQERSRLVSETRQIPKTALSVR